jgi:hypothetical protein
MTPALAGDTSPMVLQDTLRRNPDSSRCARHCRDECTPFVSGPRFARIVALRRKASCLWQRAN